MRRPASCALSLFHPRRAHFIRARQALRCVMRRRCADKGGPTEKAGHDRFAELRGLAGAMAGDAIRGDRFGPLCSGDCRWPRYCAAAPAASAGLCNGDGRGGWPSRSVCVPLCGFRANTRQNRRAGRAATRNPGAAGGGNGVILCFKAGRAGAGFKRMGERKSATIGKPVRARTTR